MMEVAHQFQLSVVATSRNDNHGGSLLTRMQYFVDGFIQQCIRHQLVAELILVEWNPPEDRASLAETLRFPDNTGDCKIRIITVPSDLHAKLKHANELPLFQMIAKNVGIRRALGKYVLATNIDILFSDEIMRYISTQLRPQILYRADRFDIPPEIPERISFDELLQYCKKTAFRINAKFGTLLKVNGRWHQPFLDILIRKIQQEYGIMLKKITKKMADWRKIDVSKIRQTNIKHIMKYSYLTSKLLVRNIVVKPVNLVKKMMTYLSDRQRLHTNACGDFTLLSYQDWCGLRGYPEWEIFSWHLDSVLLYQANRNGIKEVNLAREMSIYHIEHGSGYTPEQEKNLFTRLREKNIQFLTNHDFSAIVNDMDVKKKQGDKIIYNNENWGFASMVFREVWIG